MVNAGRRTFLGGIHVELPGDAPLLVPLADAPTLGEAVFLLGGRLKAAGLMTPRLLIGSVGTGILREAFLAGDLGRMAGRRHSFG